MQRNLRIATLFISVMPFHTALAAKAPVSLARVGAWEVKYDVDSCHLFGRFGVGEQGIVAKFTREQLGNQFSLTLYGKPVRVIDAHADVSVTFGNEPKPLERSAMSGSTNTTDKRPLLIIDRLRLDGFDSIAKDAPMAPDISPETEANVKSLLVKMPLGKAIRLETGSLGAPFKALRACTSDLVKSWGFEPDVQTKLSEAAHPTDNPGKWFQSDDYPSSSLWSGHNGLVAFRLNVDEAGKVDGCRVLYRTNPDDFADLTCKILMKRARMKPALDASGKPVRSFYVNKVRWRAGG